ncbi:MAG TPA: pseudouridine synthase, partial [Chitinophagaceae bacterium]
MKLNRNSKAGYQNIPAKLYSVTLKEKNRQFSLLSKKITGILFMDQQNGISLNKFISSTGFCSRREADKLIEAGSVTVNGQLPKLGNRVSDADVIKIDGKPLKQKEKTIYIAFNKPIGVSSTTDRKDKYNIIDYLNHPKRIFPIGRLDKPSEGLIFLTNDGDIVNKILRAGNNHEKEYIVTVDKPVTPEF